MRSAGLRSQAAERMAEVGEREGWSERPQLVFSLKSAQEGGDAGCLMKELPSGSRPFLAKGHAGITCVTLRGIQGSLPTTFIQRSRVFRLSSLLFPGRLAV